MSLSWALGLFLAALAPSVLLLLLRIDKQITGLGAFCASIFRWSRCQSDSTGWVLMNTFLHFLHAGDLVLWFWNLVSCCQRTRLFQEIRDMTQVTSKALQISVQDMYFKCQILPQVFNIGLLFCQLRRHMSPISISKGPRMRNVDKNLRTSTKLGWLTFRFFRNSGGISQSWFHFSSTLAYRRPRVEEAIFPMK